MAEFVRFMERPNRVAGEKTGNVHPLALAAMQQTGESLPQQKGRGSQRFLQGGLSAPMRALPFIIGTPQATRVKNGTGAGAGR